MGLGQAQLELRRALPNDDLPWLAAQLERVERAAAGQLTLEEALTS
jgi:hypothetical protein